MPAAVVAHDFAEELRERETVFCVVCMCIPGRVLWGKSSHTVWRLVVYDTSAIASVRESVDVPSFWIGIGVVEFDGPGPV